jgi:hypothetical protein
MVCYKDNFTCLYFIIIIIIIIKLLMLFVGILTYLKPKVFAIVASYTDTFLINNNNNSVALVRERTIPTERPPIVGEVSASFCGYRGVA